MTAPVKRNQQIEITIEDLAFGGQGLAHIGDFVIFFQRAGIPGQKVQARIKRVKGHYAEAVIEALIEKSPFEIEAPCPYFRYCGGCRFQNLPYERQTGFLAQQVAGLFTLPLSVPYMLLSTIITSPNSPLSIGLSLFPLTAPVTLPLRVALTLVPVWQLATSLTLLFLLSGCSIWFAGRAFRLGMLRYGKRLSWKELLRRTH